MDGKFKASFFFPVDESAIIDVQFSDFSHPPPSGYSEIMLEHQIF